METAKPSATPAAEATPSKRKRRTVKRKGRGRPPKLTMEILQEVGHLIAMGLTQSQACLHLGVCLATLRSALQTKPAFSSVMEKACADFLVEATRKIYSGQVGWQGAAWILERRHKPQFNRVEPQINVDASQNAMKVVIETGGETYTGTQDEFLKMVQESGQRLFVKPALEKLNSSTK